jgi:transmembrane sensor
MSESDTPRLTQAAAWRVRLTENDLESCPELSAWLAEDAGNAAAWERVQRDWALFGEHASSPELLALRSEALAHAHEAGQSRWLRSRRLVTLHRLGLAAGILILAVGGLFVWMAQPDVYTTRTERRVVKLADGSQVVLDSHSEVKVKYSAHARELILTEGQARFDVAHDIERPFSVNAAGHKVIAAGTSFNVDLFGPDLLVTLIEGRVVVSSTAARELPTVAAPIARITLDAGEQVVFSPQAPPSVARVDLDQATAWQKGDVVSDNDTLTTVVARINRYTQHAIIIGDRQTGELRISGVFHTGETEPFVSAIVAYHLPVRAEKQSDGTTLLIHR